MPRESPDDILKEGPPIRPEPDVLDWRPDSYWNSDGARIEAAFREEVSIFVLHTSFGTHYTERGCVSVAMFF